MVFDTPALILQYHLNVLDGDWYHCHIRLSFYKELVSLWSVVELVRAFLAGSFYQVISMTMVMVVMQRIKPYSVGGGWL